MKTRELARASLESYLNNARKAESTARHFRKLAKEAKAFLEAHENGAVKGATVRVIGKRGKDHGAVKILEYHNMTFHAEVVEPISLAGRVVTVEPTKFNLVVIEEGDK